MCFHGALGYVQIASNFRIVTPLKQQFDDLLLPVSHLTAIFCHGIPLNVCAPACRKWPIGSRVRALRS